MNQEPQPTGKDTASRWADSDYPTGCEGRSLGNEHLLTFCDGIAANIVARLAPKKVLDAGCARGLLVEGLRNRHVDVEGIDVSECATRAAHSSSRPHWRGRSVTSSMDKEYDLVVCIVALAHLQSQEAEETVAAFCRAAPRVLFSDTPIGCFEATHHNVRPPEYWAELFAREGFFRDVDFDGSFVSPRCVLFRQEALPPARVVSRYERRLSRLLQEIKDARDIAQDQQLAFADELPEQVRPHSRLAADADKACRALAEQFQVRLEATPRQVAETEGNDGERRIREEEQARAAATQQRLGTANQMLTQRLLAVTDQWHASQRQAEQLNGEKQQIWEELLRQSNLTLAVHHQLATLYSTRAWRFTMLCQRLRHRVVPRGSIRARVLNLSWKALRFWRHQGTWAVVRRTAGKVASRPLHGKELGTFLKRLVRFVSPSPAPTPPPPSQPAPRGAEEEASVLVSWDEPNPATRLLLSRVVRLSGWALASAGIERVQIYLADRHLGDACYGLSRPDVAHAHPGLPQAEDSGFVFNWCTTDLPDGEYELTLRVLTKDGRHRTVDRRLTVDNTAPGKHEYDAWRELFESREITEAAHHVASLISGPLFSLILPLETAHVELAARSLGSLTAQSYPHWEARVVGDGDALARLSAALSDPLAADPRILFQAAPPGARKAELVNAMLPSVQGEYLAFPDPHDEFPPHAFYQIAKYLRTHPDASLLYTDEDTIDPAGVRLNPFFKPDWSPDLLLSFNYLGGLTVFRADLIRDLGGMRSGVDGGEAYDLVLRATSRVSSVHHIPKILYHRRVFSQGQEGSGSPAGEQLALEHHLKAQRIDGKVTPGCRPRRWRVRYTVPSSAQVAVILPTGGNVTLLEQCLRGLTTKTEFRRFEVTLIDNSRGEAVRSYFDANHKEWGRATYLDCRGHPFNFSALNNLAARTTEAPLLLFLNDDTYPIDPGWLGAMVEHAVRPEVGAVGAKLLFPDHSIQHAGVVMGLSQNCDHVFGGCSGDERHPVYFDLPHVVRNCSGVTGACLLTRADVFREVGGFEEVHLPVAYQDIDLCLKIRERGYRVVYTPHALLYHYEGKTKEEKVPNPYEVRYIRYRWAHTIAHDPYYNPNLTRLRKDCSLALPF